MYPFTVRQKHPSIRDPDQRQLDLSSLIRKQQLCHHHQDPATTCLTNLAIVHYSTGPKNASEKPRQHHYVAAGPTRLLPDIVHWSSVTVCPLSGNVIGIIM
ncbi:hypothetical protein GQ55_7G329200 [Panicum hallii var. hallii]|uniref:Uncharacterized protein n=1 Tax=Panicum hallii var. hallii TaxID=1504633 RepID=A0A2T7D1K3_9POAL|nr:hypothetical protein GQ55_7G329200 [Panicum hallii var. hallii]